MAIQQSKKQSDLEKRLRLLRRQVYGGNSEQFSITQNNSDNQKSGVSENLTNRYSALTKSGSVIPSSSESFRNESFRSDLTYLHQDLLKILLFASCAIGAETILFLLVKNNVFTLNFF